MSRIAVDIDSIAIIRNTLEENLLDPAHLAVFAELGGAESIICYFRDDLKTVNERDIRILKEIVKTHFNVRCNVNGETVRKLLTIKPDMITFVTPESVDTLEPAPVNIDSYYSEISNFIADLRANDVATSAYIEPEINQIKLAGKLEFDYIEISSKTYADSENLDQQLSELENINSMVIAANRLGMGVNISGGLNQENITDIAKIQFLDDLIVGSALTCKALALGFEQAVRDFKSYI